MTGALRLESADLEPAADESVEKVPEIEVPQFLPIYTKQKIASQAELVENAELRAYKLGKKRWLYNECRLRLRPESGYYPELHVAESSRLGDDCIKPEYQDCGVAYGIKFKNCSAKLHLEVYAAFDGPQPADVSSEQTGPLNLAVFPASSTFQWPSAKRSECHKKCTGPILRSIQRYGRISRRIGKKQSPVAEASEDRAKDPRFLYLSLDEASTHVGGKKFRLIAAVYESNSRNLLGTCCSLPIQVLANNDAPNGPATVDFDIPITHQWEGWSSVRDFEGDEPQQRNNSAESLQREHYPLDSAEPSTTAHTGGSWYAGSQRQNSKAQGDLQLIKARALMAGEDEDANLEYEDSLRASKRSRPGYGQDPEVMVPSFFLRMENMPLQLDVSPEWGRETPARKLAPKRSTQGGPSTSPSITGLDQLNSPLQLTSSALSTTGSLAERWLRDAATPVERSSFESSQLRLQDISGAASGLRHNSLPAQTPDLSVMHSANLRSLTDSALRQHSVMAGPLCYSSSPYSGSLLTELQAQRSSAPLDSRESLLWASLSKPQVTGQQNSFVTARLASSHSSAIRQESLPTALVPPRELEPFVPMPIWRPRNLVVEAQNPGLSGMGTITNPFEQLGKALSLMLAPFTGEECPPALFLAKGVERAWVLEVVRCAEDSVAGAGSARDDAFWGAQAQSQTRDAARGPKDNSARGN